MALQMDQSSPPRATHAPELMEIDAIEHATGRRRAPSRSFPKPATAPNVVCFRCHKSGHSAAVCRAFSPVLAVTESDVSVKVAWQPKNEEKPIGAGRPTERRRKSMSKVATRSPSLAVHYTQLNATASSNYPRLIVLSVHVDGASRSLRALLDSGATKTLFARTVCQYSPRGCVSTSLLER